jgi:hypothetical protein
MSERIGILGFLCKSASIILVVLIILIFAVSRSAGARVNLKDVVG